MKKTLEVEHSLVDLEKQKDALLSRIMKLESDIKRPLDSDVSEQATQIADRSIHIKLLDVERENYINICNVLSKKITSSKK